MNILVLGATGTFGTALTEKLLKHTNDTITLFARHASEKYSASEHTAVIDGDALDLDDLKNAVKIRMWFTVLFPAEICQRSLKTLCKQ